MMLAGMVLIALMGSVVSFAENRREIYTSSDTRFCLGRCARELTRCLMNGSRQQCITDLRGCIDTCQSVSERREVILRRSCIAGCQGNYDACQTMINTPMDHVTCLQAKKHCFGDC